jgi:peptidoglycan/xylan/chitin deacetylase (PgdA/CDA1 family)
LKLAVLRIAKALGLFTLASWMTRHRLRILGYHGIWFLDGHYGNYLFMAPATFHERMTWLKNSKYHVTSLDAAVAELNNGRFTPYSTVITIDDGWYGTYRYMLPTLEQNSLPATLYIYTRPVDTQKILPNILIPALISLSSGQHLTIRHPADNTDIDFDIGTPGAKQQAVSKLLDIWGWGKLDADKTENLCRELTEKLGFDYEGIVASRQFSFMSYDEIADANGRGLDIQLHTDSHHVDVNTPQAIVPDIKINREKLAPHVSSTLTHFCYPSGVNSSAMHSYLTESSVQSATLVDIGLVAPESNPHALKRILDGQEISQLEFEGEMSGFMELIRGVTTLARNNGTRTRLPAE